MTARLIAALVALAGCFISIPAAAHPHVLISQVVRFIEKDGVFTHVEVEWRFDPMASEMEIAASDENRDGQLSAKEIKAVGDLALAELKELGYLTWVNIGDKDVRPKSPTFSARIANPPVFMPEDWAPTTDTPGGRMPAPGGNGAKGAPPQGKSAKPKREPRNLVYTLRFPLAQPAKTVAVTSIDPEDFVRIELDKKAAWEVIGGKATCTVDKSTTVKSEYWPGNPFYADRVTCKLP
jgi:hypothetical protein